ncbi:MAG: C39 family peptidase [Planctomycetes bacterium]|nr:C39 family peptidase [Planctomycetota bacterium]
MSFVTTLLALTACFSVDSRTLGSDDVEARRMPWVHEELHHKNPQDFVGGTFVRSELGAAGGVKLAPIAQPPNVEDDGSAVYESAVLASKQPFSELLASYNVDVPAGAGIWFEARVGRKADELWTDWLRIGEWGSGQPSWAPTRTCNEGAIDVDYFKGNGVFDLAQYRIVAWRGEARAPQIRISRVDLTFSTRNGLVLADGPKVEIPEAAWKLRLPVPFRSQKAVDPKLAPRVCSPTSLAMVLEYHGAKRGIEEVAKRVFDAEFDVYGNWTRAIQGGYTFGVAGYLTRCADWRAVERSIAVGQPLVISIAAGPGDLAGAPYEQTPGHLLVVTGFDESGNVCVNDPAAEFESSGVRTYTRAELEKCWLARGGTAYVFLSRR